MRTLFNFHGMGGLFIVVMDCGLFHVGNVLGGVGGYLHCGANFVQFPWHGGNLHCGSGGNLHCCANFVQFPCHGGNLRCEVCAICMAWGKSSLCVHQLEKVTQLHIMGDFIWQFKIIGCLAGDHRWAFFNRLWFEVVPHLHSIGLLAV